MSIYGHLLTHAHTSLVCPVCNRSYALNEINLRGVFDSVIVLQTICAKDHGPIITVLLAPVPDEAELEGIGEEEVLDFYQILETNVADISKLWKPNPKR